MSRLPDLVTLAQYGTTGVIIATLIVIGVMLTLPKTKRTSDKQLLMLLLFFCVVVLVSFFTGYVERNGGPSVFIATIKNSTKAILPDNNNIFSMTVKDDQHLSTQHVFYISRPQLKTGDTLHFALQNPQGVGPTHNAWVCFTKEPGTYTEKQISSDNSAINDDISLIPDGPNGQLECGPPGTKTGQAFNIWWALTAAFAAEMPSAKYIYTPSELAGLCNWQTVDPSSSGTTLVICDATALTTQNPNSDQLSLYIKALQNERTDVGTKASALNKMSRLTEDQKGALFGAEKIHAANCDDEEAYSSLSYSEPIALTLFDLARSSDREVKAGATQAAESLDAIGQFANFIARGQSECRNRWMLRLTTGQAQAVFDFLSKAGMPAAELEKLDTKTPDPLRTVIRPTATADGDLYRVEAKIPADDPSLRCAAKVYRLVNMQDIPGASPTSTSVSPDAQDKEFILLKNKFSNKTRVVGWYSKIFQRDILVGMHRCNVPATAIYF